MTTDELCKHLATESRVVVVGWLDGTVPTPREEEEAEEEEDGDGNIPGGDLQ